MNNRFWLNNALRAAPTCTARQSLKCAGLTKLSNGRECSDAVPLRVNHLQNDIEAWQERPGSGRCREQIPGDLDALADILNFRVIRSVSFQQFLFLLKQGEKLVLQGETHRLSGRVLVQPAGEFGNKGEEHLRFGLLFLSLFDGFKVALYFFPAQENRG